MVDFRPIRKKDFKGKSTKKAVGDDFKIESFFEPLPKKKKEPSKPASGPGKTESTIEREKFERRDTSTFIPTAKQLSKSREKADKKLQKTKKKNNGFPELRKKLKKGAKKAQKRAKKLGRSRLKPKRKSTLGRSSRADVGAGTRTLIDLI